MRKALSAAAVALVLLLAGCMRFDANLVLSPDDTVDGSYVVAVREGSGAALGVSDRKAAEQLLADSGLTDALVDTRRRAWSGDGFAGTETTFRNQPLAAFAPTPDRFGIVRDGDDFVVEGHVSAISEEDAASLEGAHLTVSVTFPGTVAEANGEVDGTTVTWDLIGGPDELHARGSAVRTTSAVPGVLTALVVLSAAGGMIVVLRRLRRRPATRGPAAPAARVATGAVRPPAPPRVPGQASHR